MWLHGQRRLANQKIRHDPGPPCDGQQPSATHGRHRRGLSRRRTRCRSDRSGRTGPASSLHCDHIGLRPFCRHERRHRSVMGCAPAARRRSGRTALSRPLRRGLPGPRDIRRPAEPVRDAAARRGTGRHCARASLFDADLPRHPLLRLSPGPILDPTGHWRYEDPDVRHDRRKSLTCRHRLSIDLRPLGPACFWRERGRGGSRNR